MSDRGRERDLVLAPNEFAFILDATKGNINVYVGPHKTSLANTDEPVVFDPTTKRFGRRVLDEAIQPISIAPEGWYLVLKNPARDGSHPRTGALNNLPDLEVGRKVNIKGPISFALWPGQMIRTIPGHQLRSNQYLLVRVYDEAAAKANWKNAVVKGRGDVEGEQGGEALDKLASELTIGKELVIRGTDVSFYMPPTGVEVVPEGEQNYVREAVTLERLEYCILLDEDGNKRYIQGPAVVFPQPTESFVEKAGARKFKAIELNENSGIYLKVIAPYEEGGRSYKVGDELFLTGKEEMIYFPRPEHAIIKYGEQETHYAVAIPAGEARYVLDRLSGQITLKRGPCIFLPDPRREVIVRRILDPRTASLWFPGNQDAIEYNRVLAAAERKEGAAPGLAAEAARSPAPKGVAQGRPAAPPAAPARAEFAGDGFTRSQSFTAPRTIVLDTRFEGAVAIAVWTGYAVLVVNKTGARRVISGPSTHLLEYDETLQSMELSTGTPKSEDKLIKTVYLRALNNKVSDKVEAETRDLVAVHLTLSYRVNFEGDPARWFDVENYVKFLCDHLRSLIRHAVKQHGIERFYGEAAAVIRDAVLGAAVEGKRSGRSFPENGMRIYDVEVLDVKIGDEMIAEHLVEAQHSVVQSTLALAAEQRRLSYTRETEAINQQVAEVQSQTRQRSLSLKTDEVGQALRLRLAEIAAEMESRQQRQAGELREQEAQGAIHAAALARSKQERELELALAGQALEQRLRELSAEVAAVSEKSRAVSPDLIAALQAFGDRALAEKMAESMAPLAILGGESVAAVLSRLLQGTPLARLLSAPPAEG
jgi:major vault protein